MSVASAQRESVIVQYSILQMLNSQIAGVTTSRRQNMQHQRPCSKEPTREMSRCDLSKLWRKHNIPGCNFSLVAWWRREGERDRRPKNYWKVKKAWRRKDSEAKKHKNEVCDTPEIQVMTAKINLKLKDSSGFGSCWQSELIIYTSRMSAICTLSILWQFDFFCILDEMWFYKCDQLLWTNGILCKRLVQFCNSAKNLNVVVNLSTSNDIRCFPSLSLSIVMPNQILRQQESFLWLLISVAFVFGDQNTEQSLQSDLLNFSPGRPIVAGLWLDVKLLSVCKWWHCLNNFSVGDT